MLEWIALGMLGVGAGFWFDTLRAREAATRTAKVACEREGLQLLDDTVSLGSLGVARNTAGHVSFRRVYRFEFTEDGDTRRNGEVTMLGKRALGVALEPYRDFSARAEETQRLPGSE